MIFLVKHDFCVLHQQEYYIGASLHCRLSFFSHLKMLANEMLASRCRILNEIQRLGPSTFYTMVTSTGKSADCLYMCSVQNLHSTILSGNRNFFFLSHLSHFLSVFLSIFHPLETHFFARITKFVPKTPISGNTYKSQFTFIKILHLFC